MSQETSPLLLAGHYDGHRVILDEPCEVPAGTKLVLSVADHPAPVAILGKHLHEKHLRAAGEALDCRPVDLGRFWLHSKICDAVADALGELEITPKKERELKTALDTLREILRISPDRIDLLDETEKRVVVMRIAGQPLTEIAKAQGMTRDAARHVQRRAVEKLKPAEH